LNDDMPIGFLVGLLVTLIFLSAFFSGTETALMSLNRYRLRHQAKSGQRAAKVTEALLKRPDRLIGLILLGNNAANLTAASLVTLISIRVGGENAIFAGTLILTFVILIFAEVAPKTIAALHPAKIALPARSGRKGAPVYALVQDEASLTDWIARATEFGAVAFDTETSALDAMRADLVGFSLSLEPGEGCYVPLLHRAAGRPQGSFDLGDAKFLQPLGKHPPSVAEPGPLGANPDPELVVFEVLPDEGTRAIGPGYYVSGMAADTVRELIAAE